MNELNDGDMGNTFPGFYGVEPESTTRALFWSRRPLIAQLVKTHRIVNSMWVWLITLRLLVNCTVD
jgi:hypothetical protein